MPNITPTALALELARARRNALHEAAELADRLGDQHPEVQAAALRALTIQAEGEVDRLNEERTAEVKAAEASKATPKESRRRVRSPETPLPEASLPGVSDGA